MLSIQRNVLKLMVDFKISYIKSLWKKVDFDYGLESQILEDSKY